MSETMFVLAPNNRDQPDEALLDDLRRVAQQLGGKKLTRTDYEKHGRFSPATIAKRFGGWGRALLGAGLPSPRNFGVSREEAIEDIRSVAKQVGADALPFSLYRSYGKYSFPAAPEAVNTPAPARPPRSVGWRLR